MVRPSKAERAFKATLMLQENGFDTPAVVAMGKYKAGFLDRENFLATIEVEKAEQFYKLLPESARGLTAEQLQSNRDLIRVFGKTVGKMHAARIFHGDLKLVNVLVRQENNRWRLFFIDNERTKQFHRLPVWLRLKNLVQLNIDRSDALTNTDRMRFFKSYLRENPSIARKRNQWVKKIIRKTNRRLTKKEK
jgi:hypothetical protein